jgi:hydrogenase maturation protein HypF
VGFRPFVYRLAGELGLTGWVKNSSRGVFIEAEGSRPKLEDFRSRLETEKPVRSFIQSFESSYLDAVGYETFDILPSDDAGDKTALILPDSATCDDCLGEVLNPTDRRFRYPFTNCTNCGPRYTIIEELPYDRPKTTMKAFQMCAACQREYEDPRDRRFHAQPNACPECGPQLELWDQEGKPLASRFDALLTAAESIRCGQIVAAKGLGGFHLMVDARNEEAVERLRQRKHREEKPLALMIATVAAIRGYCEVSATEERLLRSPESPIVLLRRNPTPIQTGVAPSVAPGNPYLGVMVPYTPLHHLLLGELRFPVVATSGNLSDEPICTDEREAAQRLGGIADVFLVHDRPIARHVDDSVVRVVAGREMVMRRARGYAPLPVHCNESLPSLLAVGAHLKNSVAVSVNRDIFVSQHIGDLETAQALTAFKHVTQDLQKLYELAPEATACDAHPDYLSTQFARRNGLPVVYVQHHYAHVLACMAENELSSPVLGVSWDGTGYGLDGTVWGGEFLLATRESFQRAGHFRTFPLPGGERAIREPRRAALGLLYEVLAEEAFSSDELLAVHSFSANELEVLRTMLAKGLNSPRTSSAGRLFDAIAALTGIRQGVAFEGQAAMELEFALDGVDTEEAYRFRLVDAGDSTFTIDWEPLVRSVLDDVRDGISAGMISAKFHNALAETIVGAARRVGEERIVLTGGCFQNKYLTERVIRRLDEEGFRPYWHQRIPPNDGGIAVGQIVAAAHRQEKG